MKAILALLVSVGMAKGDFTDFYVQSGGDNRNSGSTAESGAVATSTGGEWDYSSPETYRASSGAPFVAVRAGEWASIFPDGAAVTPYVARIEAVGAGGATITLSATAKSGIKPVGGASGMSCRVGGAWAGPGGSLGFPFTFVESGMKNLADHPVRVNFKGTYQISAEVVLQNDGPIFWQGYATAPGDEGYAVLDGGTTGVYYNLIRFDQAPAHAFIDWHFQNNGGTGKTQSGINIPYQTKSHSVLFLRCSASGMSSFGIENQEEGSFVECEFWGNNVTNLPNRAGAYLGKSSSHAIRCIFHDNSGSNSSGIFTDGGTMFFRCIMENNGRNGLISSGDVTGLIYQCDFYSNGRSGCEFMNPANMLQNIQSSLFVANGMFGIETGLFRYNGVMLNNAFGAGTQGNKAGNLDVVEGMIEIGSLHLAANATPYRDPGIGDFDLILSDVFNAARGKFPPTVGTAGTVGYGDIGASQR